MKLLLALLILGLAVLVFRLVWGQSSTEAMRLKLGPLTCRLTGHRRRGDVVRKVDDGYQSRCRNCGVRLRKASREAEWEVDPTPLETPGASQSPASTTTLLALLCAGALAAVSLGLLLAPHEVRMREAGDAGVTRLALNATR